MKSWLLLYRNQFSGFIREPVAAVFNLLIPLIIVVMQAIAYGGQSLDGAGVDKYTVIDTLPCAAITMYVMIIGLFGMGVGLSSLIETRALAGFSLRPGGANAILSAYGAVLFTVAALGLAVALAVLMLGWSSVAPAQPVGVVCITVIALLGFLGMGAAIACLVGSPRSVQGVASAFFFPMLFLSGATFPIDYYPEGLISFAHMLPGVHVYDLLAAFWFPEAEIHLGSLIYLVVFAVAGVGLAFALLKRREDV